MNKSYSPSSGVVTSHLIQLESLQFTEIFRLSSFALPPISAAVDPYRRIYGVSPWMRGSVVRGTAARRDSGEPRPAERAPAAPLVKTFKKSFLLKMCGWKEVFNGNLLLVVRFGSR